MHHALQAAYDNGFTIGGGGHALLVVPSPSPPPPPPPPETPVQYSSLPIAVAHAGLVKRRGRIHLTP